MSDLLNLKKSVFTGEKGFPLIFLAFFIGTVSFYLIKCNVFEIAERISADKLLQFGGLGCVFVIPLLASAAFSAMGIVLLPLVDIFAAFAFAGVSDYVISVLVSNGGIGELVAAFAVTYLCVFLTIALSVGGINFSLDLFSAIKSDKFLWTKFLKSLLLMIVFSAAFIFVCLFLPGIK